MPRVVAIHAVVDVQRWLEGKAAACCRHRVRLGSNVTDYVAADRSNNIAITADVADVDAMKAMIASPSPEAAALMERHGVVPPITAYFEA